MGDKRIRIGAVNYLNTKPLIFELEQLTPTTELILDYPSRLAERLKAGGASEEKIKIAGHGQTAMIAARALAAALWPSPYAAVIIRIRGRMFRREPAFARRTCA